MLFIYSLFQKSFKLFLVFICLLLSHQAIAQANLFDGSSLVKPKLVVGESDLSQPFTMGIEFTIEPGWHIYWTNPGDAGLPIEFEWELPKGYTVQDIQYPVPVKFVESGVVGYGYSGEVVLLATVIPPKDAEISDKTISANISWLACKEICLPGQGRAELDLSSLSTEARLDNQSKINQWQNKLPLTLNQANLDLVSAEIKKNGKKADLQLIFAGRDAEAITDLFPYIINNALINYNQITVKDGVIKLSALLDNDSVKVRDLQGVLKFQDKGIYFTTSLTPVSSEFTSVATARSSEGGINFFAILGLAFIGGLLLNIMPCVLPVLSLKVLGFVEHAQKDKAHSRNLSLAFMLGVIMSFWLLAGVVGLLQQAGEQIGWGFQFQSPAFVIAMSVVVFVFGLNLVGVFEFATPAVTGQVGSGLSRNDWVGSFMNGVLATTLATPCTAPFLGTALGFAFSQPFYTIFLIFTVVGLGLASPYVLLSLNPKWLKFIPKPGPWMNRFKQGMGFLLFATLVWLLSVLGSQLGAQAIVAALALLLGIGFALWMIGAFLDFNSSKAKRVSIWTSAIVIMALSYVVTMEGWLQLREQNTPEKTLISESGSSIKWNAFSVEYLEETVSKGKPVFIDFTADWCFTCKVTEQTVIETDLVRSKIDEYAITPIKADWTSRNDEITSLLKQYGRSGVPLYVVIPGGRLSDPIILPEVITQSMLIDAFRDARAQTLSSALQ